MVRGVALLAVLLLAGCSSLPGFAPARTTWAFDATQLEDLRGRGLDGSGVTVAIIDTGLDATHPDLQGMHLVGWTDLAGGSQAPVDKDGHGTHVAALVAGQSPLRGGAPGVSLLDAKVFDGSGKASDSSVANGIDWAVAHGAAVIGLSLGGGTLPVLGSATEDAARSAVGKGVLVVAAAGNDGPGNSDVKSPADVAGVIAVGAVDKGLHVAAFSNRGADDEPLLPGFGGGLPRQAPDQKPEVVAPGVKITSAWVDHQYAEADGTSDAVPFVVSALALMLQAHPGARPHDANGVEKVKGWLEQTAKPIDGAQRPHDKAAGYGFLQAAALVDKAA